MVMYKLQTYFAWKTKQLLENSMVEDNHGNYSILLRETVQTDSFCYDAVIFLLILQMGILLLHYFSKTDDEI